MTLTIHLHFIPSILFYIPACANVIVLSLTPPSQPFTPLTPLTPPGNLDLLSQRSCLRLDFNPWQQIIADQLLLGPSHVMETLRNDSYKL